MDKHQQAEKDYMQGMKYKDIAAKYDVSLNTVKSWKQRYAWTKKGVHTKPKKGAHKKKNAPNQKKPELEANSDEIDNPELTEKQRLFCLYYVKYWNAGKSANKAGYECSYPNGFYEIGCQLLKKTQVREEVERLKRDIVGSIFLEAQAVLQKYIDIAFADITDYVSFGKREQQAIGMYGPIFEGKGEDKTPVMEEVNYVDLKESPEIDGTIITEVKQGNAGVSIKLADKMKALDKLSEYFDLFPDKFKRHIEEEKLKLQKSQADPSVPDAHDDGFMEALHQKASEVWNDGKSDNEET